MKTKFKIRSRLIVAAAAIVSITACNKVLDKTPQNALTQEQVYRNVFDADAAVVGLYGKFMGLAKQYVVLNELRADLLDVTQNADADLRDLNEHNVKENNVYADPRPFYTVINNCNDILKNFNIMLRDKKFTEAEYQQRYSDVGALRCWLYLQLGIHWGNVPYVTDALDNIDVIRDQSKFPVLPFNQLLDSLISFSNTLNYQKPYPFGATVNTGLITTYDGYNTRRFFIDKYALLGDLNLWRGNYTTAATYYRKIMEHDGYDTDISGLYNGGDQFYAQFRQVWQDVTNNNDLCVGYIRGKESDLGSLIDNNSQGWRSMFARSQDNLWLSQWLWSLPFNSNFAPENPFVGLFSNNGGSYLLKPSVQAIQNWNSQLQQNGFPFDARGNFSWRTLNGQPVVMKYLYYYLDGTTFLPTSPLKKEGRWFLNRAANVHLHFAEAANRDNRRRLAYGILNFGIRTTFSGPGGAGTNIDQTNFQNTLYDAAPYNFDARYSDVPRFRADWHRGGGVRGAARVVETGVVGDSTLSIENSLIDENALEMAFEGHRWGELVRVALRRNDPAFLADRVYNKLLKAGNPNAATVRAKLLNRSNWYLPFKF